MSEYRKNQILAAKKVADFIRQHPEGVTAEQIKEAGLPAHPVYYLVSKKYVQAFQVREPERGPRAYHWLWKPIAPKANPTGEER